MMQEIIDSIIITLLPNYSSRVYYFAGSNVWDDDYPGSGNYWSDYTGNDYYWGQVRISLVATEYWLTL